MSYVSKSFGYFGKGMIAPPPPPDETGPIITPEEEQEIMRALLPAPQPEQSRSMVPWVVGGAFLLLTAAGFVFILKT